MKRFTLLIITIILSLSVFSQNEEILKRLKQAETAEERGQFPNAIKLYEEILELKPDFADAYKNLALVCEKMKTVIYLEQAIKNFKKYISLVPSEKEKINDKIWELEYIVKEIKDFENIKSNLLGVWKTTSYNSKTGQPDCVLEIISFQGNLRIKVLPTGKIFSTTLTNIVSTTQVLQDEAFKNNLLFGYTDSKTHISDPSKFGKGLIVLSPLIEGFTGIPIDPLAGVLENTPERRTEAQKYYDFCIDYFEKDTLAGLVNQFSSIKDAKTGNIMIEYDDVIPVQFVRGGDYYNISKKKSKPEINKIPKRTLTTLGFSAVLSMFEKTDKYDNSGANIGGAMNLDFTFFTKKSFGKKNEHGFAMGFEFLAERAGRDMIVEVEFANRYGSGDVYELYIYRPSFAWNFRYTMGWAGISKISDKHYLTWGIKPIGFHFLSYGWVGKREVSEGNYHSGYYGHSYYTNGYKRENDAYYDMFGLGICGSFDFGYGMQTSKNCIITPFIRFSYAVDYFAGNDYIYRYYKNFSVFPITLQAGVSFVFRSYKKDKTASPQSPKNTSRIGNSITNSILFSR